jgi:hypothetical protein
VQKDKWGTQAILDAPVRETQDTPVVEVNPNSSVRLIYKLDKNRGTVWLNGHPFQSAAQMISALSRKAALVELKSRRNVAAKK